MKRNNTKLSWFSSIIALIMVGFLLVITAWVYNLIMKELNDNRSLWNYVKTYAWALSSIELALLDVKNRGYWVDSSIENSINSRSIMLSDNPSSIWDFSRAKDVLISYDLWTRTDIYTWSILALWYEIIPLFYIDNDSNEQKVSKLELQVLWGDNTMLSWNLLWNSSWISWIWWFDPNSYWKGRNLVNSKLEFTNINTEDFLDNSYTNYLILFNASNSDLIYKLESIENWKFFTKPKTQIIWSWEKAGYRQNIRVDLDNSEFLNTLKYSIYSN